ncbi:hypothetical protein Cantr_07769 [Candida viswanathii]|uniref:Uncharacterized protein n=1 Tax=Candida viswanathii TaxID=5486 RepID=A0A367XZM0_9ASCO|nr:hypothetical protein Cantr_07769 [Candida viswanathii]
MVKIVSKIIPGFLFLMCFGFFKFIKGSSPVQQKGIEKFNDYNDVLDNLQEYLALKVTYPYRIVVGEGKGRVKYTSGPPGLTKFDLIKLEYNSMISKRPDGKWVNRLYESGNDSSDDLVFDDLFASKFKKAERNNDDANTSQDNQQDNEVEYEPPLTDNEVLERYTNDLKGKAGELSQKSKRIMCAQDG